MPLNLGSTIATEQIVDDSNIEDVLLECDEFLMNLQQFIMNFTNIENANQIRDLANQNGSAECLQFAEELLGISLEVKLPEQTDLDKGKAKAYGQALNLLKSLVPKTEAVYNRLSKMIKDAPNKAESVQLKREGGAFGKYSEHNPAVRIATRLKLFDKYSTNKTLNDIVKAAIDHWSTVSKKFNYYIEGAKSEIRFIRDVKQGRKDWKHASDLKASIKISRDMEQDRREAAANYRGYSSKPWHDLHKQADWYGDAARKTEEELSKYKGHKYDLTDIRKAISHCRDYLALGYYLLRALRS